MILGGTGGINRKSKKQTINEEFSRMRSRFGVIRRAAGIVSHVSFVNSIYLKSFSFLSQIRLVDVVEGVKIIDRNPVQVPVYSNGEVSGCDTTVDEYGVSIVERFIAKCEGSDLGRD